MKCNCGNPIEQERLEFKLSTCVRCARSQPQERPRGIMLYGHKTAGEIQIVSQEAFQDYRKYNPCGRYTGRGSGLHRVSRSTASI